MKSGEECQPTAAGASSKRSKKASRLTLTWQEMLDL